MSISVLLSAWDHHMQSGNKKKDAIQEKFKQKFLGYGVSYVYFSTKCSKF